MRAQPILVERNIRAHSGSVLGVEAGGPNPIAPTNLPIPGNLEDGGFISICGRYPINSNLFTFDGGYRPTIGILQPYDVVFAQIGAGLHFNDL